MEIGTLLVAFGYQNSSADNLPGAQYDLKVAYDYAKCIGARKCIVVTDVPCNLVDAHLAETIYEAIGQLHNMECILFYYSGHSRKGCMILPDGGDIPITDVFYRLAAKRLLAVIDGCYAANLGMPFVFSNGAYVAREWVIPWSQIICLSAQNANSLLEATKEGSLFTLMLFKLLREYRHTVRPIAELERQLARHEDRTPMRLVVHASRPTLYWLWAWCVPNCHLDVELVANPPAIKITYPRFADDIKHEQVQTTRL